MNSFFKSFALVAVCSMSLVSFAEGEKAAAPATTTTTTAAAPAPMAAPAAKKLSKKAAKKACIKENKALKSDKAGLEACVTAKLNG